MPSAECSQNWAFWMFCGGGVCPGSVPVLRVVCSTRPSGSTSKPIGSPTWLVSNGPLRIWFSAITVCLKFDSTVAPQSPFSSPAAHSMPPSR